ncbi:MAG: phosphatidate cytidylyltransferase [Rhodocyclaceae bacterium]|nr:phosphatidate cytidylyltransferase [Rhodocyclaceae bacterium]
MLITRIITALVILPVVFIALFSFPNWAWDLFTLAITLVACWEWSRFCRLSRSSASVFFIVSLAGSAVVFFAYLGMTPLTFATIALVGFIASALFWLMVAPVWLANTWRPEGSIGTWVVAFTGWVVIFPTWFAFLMLHDLGPWMLLSFALIVWVADIAAYFVGKSVGKRKLAPSISPGKTIEGAAGGLIGVGVYFFVWQQLVGSAAARGEDWARELSSHGWLLFGMFMLLGVVSIVGDLFESWMKRGVGMKDSSSLLPGHGGILDRIDALTSTLPLAGLYLLVMQKL